MGMSRITVAAVIVLMAMVPSSGTSAAGELRLFDLAKEVEVSLAEALPQIMRNRIILVGEQHDEERHHAAQLQVIKAVEASGVPLAVGLEMFQAESQDALDAWVDGRMSEAEFKEVFRANWNMPWFLYGGIFEYARERKIPLVGLNVSRAITRQVAKSGFASLSMEQRAQLPFVECRVDREYMDFIRRAYGAHAHGGFSFQNFCEAQLVWDKFMAVKALAYLKTREKATMVLIAGIGHAWKEGIPAQLMDHSTWTSTVLLPRIPGTVDQNTIRRVDADYLILDR